MASRADQWPPLVFRVREMSESSGRHRQWPPRALGSNLIVPRRGNSPEYFACLGQRIQEIVTPEQQLPPDYTNHHLQTISIYHKDYKFSIVNYDATLHAVGDAHQNMSAGNSDDEPTEDTPSDQWINWQPMRFNHRENPFYDSFVTFAGNMRTLRAQRKGQSWRHTILPRRYHSEEEVARDQLQQAGMNGYLTILIALIVMAYPSSQTKTVLTELYNGTWNLQRPNRNGWTPGRGLVVSVWAYPGYSTVQRLKAFERGESGQIFP